MQYSDYQGEKISRLGFGLMRLPVIDDDQTPVGIVHLTDLLRQGVV